MRKNLKKAAAVALGLACVFQLAVTYTHLTLPETLRFCTVPRVPT